MDKNFTGCDYIESATESAAESADESVETSHSWLKCHSWYDYTMGYFEGMLKNIMNMIY